MQAPVLAKADMTKTSILETHASLTHVAAVLIQHHDDGLPRVIVIFLEEVSYPATDSEALGNALASHSSIIFYGVRGLQSEQATNFSYQSLCKEQNLHIRA